jgi:aspartyl-tRNA(Asn)/glutamyl-tRNA(Gln) amidotransferase subunit A
MTQEITSMTLTELAGAYRSDALRPTLVAEAYLTRLEPGPLYRVLTPERARQQARAAEEKFKAGIDIGPLQGIPLALKDLMDTEGVVTAAGSKVLADDPPALEDCPAAARLDAAGAVFLGKTNMTELAFSGLGINPHFGTPGCAYDPERIPGGSSSGSGVAVASGLACAAIGSDTGGSVRIPAAFNGLLGLKTTDGAIPVDGCVPLSTTLDTLGPLTRTTEDAWHVWRALAALPHQPFQPREVTGLRFLAPTAILQEDLDPRVKAAFARTLEHLTEMGADVETQEAPILREIPALYARHGTFAGLESLALYEEMLEREGDRIDPRVSARILAGRDRRATDYLRLTYARKRLQAHFWEAYARFDAVLSPTVAILPPKVVDLQEDEAYFRTNALVLRNTMVFNFLGVPAASVPCATTAEGLPVGFMIAARPHQEELVLSIARAIEQLVRA